MEYNFNNKISYPIFNQGKEGHCAFYAILAALVRLNPQINIDNILLQKSISYKGVISLVASLKWFKDNGYIKDYSQYRYNRLTIDKEPIVARIHTHTDWSSTRKPPFKLTYTPGVTNTFAHYVCIVGKNTCVNSWGDKFGDKGYFYFDDSQLHRFSQIHKLII